MLSRTIALYKTSFTGLSRQTWLLSVVMLINRSGTMVVPFMTLYLTSKTMNRSLSEAGLVVSLFGLGSIIGAYYGGKLSDKLGFHRIQLVTLFFGGILFIFLGQIRSYPLICICTFILSIVNEAFRPANSSAISFYSSIENRTRSYSLNRLAINLGWAVGGTIGGMLASINYELLFWVDGLTNIGAALLLFNFLKPEKRSADVESSQTKDATPVRSAYKDITYLKFIFLVTLFGLCFFQMFTTVPKYFRDNLGLSEQYIGFTMALNGALIVLLEMVLVYSLEGKKKHLTYISIGHIFCAIAFFCLLLPGNAKFVSILLILFITVGEITAMPFMSSYWSMRCNDNNRGQYAGLFTISWGIAQTLGPTLASLLVEASSFKVLFVAVGAVLLLASMGFFVLSRIKEA